MKEIIAMIRPKKVSATRNALVQLGYTCLTGIAVRGRGNQCGIAEEVGVTIHTDALYSSPAVGMRYVPKRMLSVIVPDDSIEKVKNAIIAVNQTGQIGDGKIFVSSIEEAIRIRTGESGVDAI